MIKLVKLMRNRYFLSSIAILTLLTLSCFNRIAAFIFGVSILLIYIFVHEKSRKPSALEILLVVFTVVIIGTGPARLKYEITRWGDKLFNAKYQEVRVTTPWVAFIAQSPGSKTDVKEEKINILSKESSNFKTNELETAALIASSLVKQKIENNLVNNGDFNIPLTSNLSQWGHGLYSDVIKTRYPNINFVWFNFLNADIDIMVEKTEVGNALKIIHRSEKMNHKVGIMEQRVRVVPGKYKVSFIAKALTDFEQGGIWISTNDGWVGPCETDKKGPFEWQVFSKEVELNKIDDITFTVISQGKGTVFITDISLVKVSDL